MVQKLLFVSNIAGTKAIGSFSYSSFLAARDLGFEFHVAANYARLSYESKRTAEERYGVRIHHIDLDRSPYSAKNMRAYQQLVKLIKEEGIEFIHCNTPTGGLLGRIAGKKCGVKRVIYQAHGFHFYKGAPLVNWLVYYPVERWLARHTDALITINKADYDLAVRRFRLRNQGKVYYVPGVGVDLDRFRRQTVERDLLRRSFGVGPKDIMLITMGELVVGKNYQVAIEAVARAKLPHLKYVICGNGPDLERLKRIAETLGVSSQVIFLGYRSDIKELLEVADIFLFTSLREGLPRSMMEAMASGLPCIASKIRGNSDLISDGVGGFLCNPTDVAAFAHAITVLTKDRELRHRMGQYNLKAIADFDVSKVREALVNVYVREFCGTTTE